MLAALISLTLTSLALAGILTLVLRAIPSIITEAVTERAVLLQRIQAPEQAVIDHATQAFPMPEPNSVAMDDDIAQWAAIGVEVPKEALADQVFGTP